MSTQDYSKNAKEMFERIEAILLNHLQSGHEPDSIKDLVLSRQILLNELRDGETWKAYADSMINADPNAEALNAYEAPTWGQENK